MSETSAEETLLEFPCDYPIKAMGESEPEFERIVLEIVQRHAQEMIAGGFSVKKSTGGKYTSVTITIRAHSKQQLNAIYQDLAAHDKVKYAL